MIMTAAKNVQKDNVQEIKSFIKSIFPLLQRLHFKIPVTVAETKRVLKNVESGLS